MQTQSLLLANLAFSDSIMGIYLLIIASVDVYYRENYALHDKSWKTSRLCKVAGFLSTVSSETSVLSLTVITIDRFIVIVLNSLLLKLGKKHVKGILVFMWIFVFIISLVPCFNTGYFNNFYGQSEMCLPLPLASKRQTAMNYTIEDLGMQSFGLRTKKHIAKPVNTSKPNGWEFSVLVFLGINGVSFLAILIMYVQMFLSVRKVQAAVRSTQQRDDLALAKKMTIILGTDAFCWFPVIGLGLYCLAGNSLPVQVSGIFILQECFKVLKKYHNR